MKKVILLLLGFIPMFSFAGVIMTTNGERIEDVTIQNETSESIVYVENGVEKTISIEQVQAVLFDNGNFKEYPKYTPIISGSESTSSQNGESVVFYQEKPQRQPRDFSYGNSFDPNGEKLWLSGWCTAGSGLGVMIVGIICAAAGDGPGPDGVGVTFISMGAISTAASIPLLTIGGMRKFKKNDQNVETADALILELQAQKNQVGLALKF